MDTVKRWAKGLLWVVGAWLGGFNELPYEAPEPEKSDTPEEGE